MDKKMGGEAENALIAAGFPSVYIFRPAYIHPVEPRKEPNFSYRLIIGREWQGINIVFGRTNCKVICLDPVTLTTHTLTQVPGAITNAIAVDPNRRRIYVPTYTNEMYAFAEEPRES